MPQQDGRTAVALLTTSGAPPMARAADAQGRWPFSPPPGQTALDLYQSFSRELPVRPGFPLFHRRFANLFQRGMSLFAILITLLYIREVFSEEQSDCSPISCKSEYLGLLDQQIKYEEWHCSSECGKFCYSFKCSNGQCIRDTSVCDGATDCRDGSDETLATCSKLSVECPSYAFRCAYGACIDKNKICNDVQDCADNSDELLPQCKKNKVQHLTNAVCRKDEFTCNSGNCIDATLLCDGTTDCYDGSDETITQCINIRCPSYSFQCAYGACIDRDKKCNGIEDCKDGSDEDDELCEAKEKPTKKPYPSTSTTSRPIHTNGCPIPDEPNGGYFVMPECSPGDKSPKCRKVPGTIVRPFTVIRFHCYDGFALPGNGDTSFCNNKGKWDPELPECKKLCPPLKSDSLHLSCHYLGSPVNCSTSLKPGTTVSARCKPAFHLEDFSSAVSENECLPDGTWAHPLFSCKSDCGIKNAVKQLISYAPVADSVYPWHVALYKNFGQEYICGGSIITEKAIVTAAHCVYNETTKKTIGLEDFRIAAGKFRRTWNLRDTNEQRFAVVEIIIKDTYLGGNNRYEHDIAVLAISGTININPSVMPICIDRFSSVHFKSTDLGTVVGWGTTETGVVSEELRATKLPYFDFHACRSTVSTSFSHFITYDKFCAGLRNGTQLGRGDSGGGLTFSKSTPENTERHFLYGVVSVTDPDNHDITAFTNVTIHVPWLDKVLTAIKKRRG